jgi:hypothetical protein
MKGEGAICRTEISTKEGRDPEADQRIPLPPSPWPGPSTSFIAAA